MGSFADIKTFANEMVRASDPFAKAKDLIDELLRRLLKVPTYKILPTKAAFELYTSTQAVAEQTLQAGNDFLQAFSTRFGLDTTYFRSVLTTFAKTITKNLSPYAPKLKQAVETLNAGGAQYVDMGDSRFLLSLRYVLTESRMVLSTINDQEAAKSWVWSIPGFSKIATAAVVFSGAVQFVLDIGMTLLKLPGQALGFVDKVVRYATYAGAAFLGYKLFVEKDAPFKLSTSTSKPKRRR